MITNTKSWLVVVIVLAIIFSGIHSQTDDEENLLVPTSTLDRKLCQCGKLTRALDVERIGSARIPDGRLPWLAELVTSPAGYRETFTGFEKDYPLCFGTLINLRTVLFPASCINKYSRIRPKVKLHGVESRNESLVEVRSALIHPRFKGKLDNDLALVRLMRPLIYNQTRIVPICLPKVKKTIYPVPYPTANYSSLALANGDGKFDRLVGDEEWVVGQLTEEEFEPDGRSRPCRNPNPPCTKRPCPPCPLAAGLKQPYVLDYFVLRRWFNRRGPGYEYVQRFGRFQIQTVNDTMCHSTFPEFLQSKALCVEQKRIKDVLKQRYDFFMKMEMGMPAIVANTTLKKGKPQPTTTKFYLEGMRAPGRSGVPFFDARKNITSLMKIHDYVPWIMENTFETDYCIV